MQIVSIRFKGKLRQNLFSSLSADLAQKVVKNTVQKTYKYTRVYQTNLIAVSIVVQQF